MTTIDTRPEAADAAAGDAASDPGSRSAVEAFFVTAAAWVTTTDHKRIGRLYLAMGLLVLTATAVLGAVLGFERADDGAVSLDADALLQTFQAYRVGLVFGAVIPLGLGLAIAIAPLQLGARSIAFPRLALTGFYSWVGGLALTFVALGRNGGIGGGDNQAIDLFLAGHGLMILGLLASAGCVATSVLTTRAPGMTMRRVPLFAWSALVGSLAMLVALPVAFGAIVYLFIDHRYAQLNFGGAEGIGDWIGWAFSVPAVIVYALPAVGVAAEMIPVTFKNRQALRGVAFAGIALVGVAALAATTQQFVHEVTFDTGGERFVRDAVPFLIFAGLPLLGLAVVMGLGGLTAQGGLANGRPSISSGFVFSFLGLGMVGAGIAGNFLMGITDVDLIRGPGEAEPLFTTFEEGATIYVVYGTALAVMGGVVFWAPKLWGRQISEKQVLPLALLGVLATVLAGLPLYIAGFLDQVGGVPANDADVAAMLVIDGDTGALWNGLSLAGHALMALTVLAFGGLLLKTFAGAGEQADDNPVGGHTIEWSTSSPAPADNFEHVPTVASPEPQFDLTYEGTSS
ncbi:MAG: cbb3-type cytochrome c oxidase subunit I [Ilumatobacter sp.]|uniref:cbb3-type cytochrome c oxidase subunit I n=1 Tax=Ilumatobacter sp. TaxID=1967498 RepID=UPI0026170E1D|nr:cbb3-type cytochrome c oxidase subunit I [Ilumatobacter sp.]MDJ0770297.1 cbb3-type cytochrome c oxidase subunit I [Ilumatobacter sp.]